MLDIKRGGVMNLVKTKGKYSVADFIRDLLRVNGVSHEALCLYEEKNRDEILRINDIFLLKTEEDVRQCAVLLRLLCPEHADEVAGYFLNGNMPDTCFGLRDVERYKLKLLTGLDRNYQFFALSWNWRTSLREKALYISESAPARAKKHKNNKPSIVTSWPPGRPFGSAIRIGTLNMMQRASTPGNNILLHKTVALDDTIKGELYIIDRKEGKIEARFVFTEYPKEIPHLKIKADGKDILLNIPVSTPPGTGKRIIKSRLVPMIDPEDNIFIERLPEGKNG
jgi:hypothetical protein